MEKLQAYVTKIANINGNVEIDPFALLVIELVLKILVNRCSKFNVGTANQPGILDRWWLWFYVKYAARSANEENGFYYSKETLKYHINKVYNNFLKAGATAADSEIRDIVNCVTKG